jgi:hypothetical protein
VIVLVGVAAVAYTQGLIPGTTGCVLRSVDKREYVAANEAVFRTIRLPSLLREARINTWHHGIPAPNKCIPIENGPPYSSYITTYVYSAEAVGRPVGLDPRVLRGWTRDSVGNSNYHRGTATLYVDTTEEGVLLRIDHRGYAERLP